MSTSFSSSSVIRGSAVQDSKIKQYQRVAQLEAVLSIKEQQQRSHRRMVLWTTVAILGILGLAAARGWL